MNLTINIVNTSGSPLVCDTIDVGGSITNGNSSVIESITDNTSISILIINNGYYTYQTLIDNVYEDDNIINIVLVENLPINDPNYNKPYPNFFSFKNPCTYDVDSYVASSLVGTVSWYINNSKIYSTGFKFTYTFKEEGDYQIKLRSTYINSVTCSLDWDQYYATTVQGNTILGDIESESSYLVLDVATNITIPNIIPDFQLITFYEESPNYQGCFTLVDEISIIPDITFRGNSDDWSYKISVKDPQDNIILLTQFDGLTGSETDFTPYKVTFIGDTHGGYTITGTLIDNHCNSSYVHTIIEESCSVITADYLECTKYRLNNTSPTRSLDITIIYHHSNEQLGDIISLNPLESVEIDLNLGIGIYLVNVEWDDGTEDIILNGYCQIYDCITDYITSILCEPCDPCKDICEYELQWSKMFSLTHVYFSKLQSEFGFNNVYTGFDIDKLNSLTTIQDIALKLESFCSCGSWKPNEDYPCGNGDCGDTTSDCGCGGKCGGCGNSSNIKVSSTSNCGCK